MQDFFVYILFRFYSLLQQMWDRVVSIYILPIRNNFDAKLFYFVKRFASKYNYLQQLLQPP